ncbi:hypothetical protein HYN43_013255 [Mucilaginibacter celer]|uniref:Uncharacterized protein n=1 Tax=Mucilaginibacter celer TaxID=2305508 RepID=A0A494VS23_9SPHI|nr:hypothetical protein HYN43_013255 [Mucilaginibacter celer]
MLWKVSNDVAVFIASQLLVGINWFTAQWLVYNTILGTRKKVYNTKQFVFLWQEIKHSFTSANTN